MAKQIAQYSNYLVSVAFGLIFVAYPYLVYSYGSTVSPKWFACVLLVLVVTRAIFLREQATKSDHVFTLAIVIFIVTLFFADNEQLLKFYPVVMNIGVGLLFLLSLNSKQSLIEKFASLGKKKPPIEAKSYLRTLTALWGGLLILNSLVSAYTACYASVSIWALYNGVICYLIFAIFALGEYIFRGFYKKKHNIIDG